MAAPAARRAVDNGARRARVQEHLGLLVDGSAVVGGPGGQLACVSVRCSDMSIETAGRRWRGFILSTKMS